MVTTRARARAQPAQSQQAPASEATASPPEQSRTPAERQQYSSPQQPSPDADGSQWIAHYQRGLRDTSTLSRRFYWWIHDWLYYLAIISGLTPLEPIEQAFMLACYFILGYLAFMGAYMQATNLARFVSGLMAGQGPLIRWNGAYWPST